MGWGFQRHELMVPLKALKSAYVDDFRRLLEVLKCHHSPLQACSDSPELHHKSHTASTFKIQILLEWSISATRMHVLMCRRITWICFNCIFWAPETRICDSVGLVRSSGICLGTVQAVHGPCYGNATLRAVGFQRKERRGSWLNHAPGQN